MFKISNITNEVLTKTSMKMLAGEEETEFKPRPKIDK